jgi:hypothetical protein
MNGTFALATSRNSAETDSTMMATKSKKPPWKKPASSKSRHTKLSPKSKAKAKASAKRAGRHYPNLVDNMNAAKKQRSKS